MPEGRRDGLERDVERPDQEDREGGFFKYTRGLFQSWAFAQSRPCMEANNRTHSRPRQTSGGLRHGVMWRELPSWSRGELGRLRLGGLAGRCRGPGWRLAWQHKPGSRTPLGPTRPALDPRCAATLPLDLRLSRVHLPPVGGACMGRMDDGEGNQRVSPKPDAFVRTLARREKGRGTSHR